MRRLDARLLAWADRLVQWAWAEHGIAHIVVVRGLLMGSVIGAAVFGSPLTVMQMISMVVAQGLAELFMRRGLAHLLRNETVPFAIRSVLVVLYVFVVGACTAFLLVMHDPHANIIMFAFNFVFMTWFYCVFARPPRGPRRRRRSAARRVLATAG